jgi:hypothetical protein
MMPGGGSPSTSVAKYIYIARNPKDVAILTEIGTVSTNYL